MGDDDGNDNVDDDGHDAMTQNVERTENENAEEILIEEKETVHPLCSEPADHEVVDPESEDTEIDDGIVLETNQRRELDEYDTEEDAAHYVVDRDPEEMSFRKMKEDELRRSAMLLALDRRQNAKLNTM